MSFTSPILARGPRLLQGGPRCSGTTGPVLKYHAVGRWQPGRVHVRFVQSSRQEADAARQAMDAAWDRMSADTAVNLFDGPMCRLEGFQLTEAQLHLDLSVTSYRVFLGTNLYGPRDLPPEALANPLGVSPALETADGFLLFGRRGGRVAYYPHRLHPFSGSLEPPTGPELLDIFAECRRELAEELCLSAEEVPEIVLLGIVEDEQIRHPELILNARTTLTSDQLAARLDPAEHVAVHKVPAEPTAIAEALLEPAFTPVGLAVLRLFADRSY